MLVYSRCWRGLEDAIYKHSLESIESLLKDLDLGKANLIGLSETDLESEFGNDHLTFENRIVYPNNNKLLILELENSKVKSFRYIKLNTEKVDKDLIGEIMK